MQFEIDDFNKTFQYIGGFCSGLEIGETFVVLGIDNNGTNYKSATVKLIPENFHFNVQYNQVTLFLEIAKK